MNCPKCKHGALSSMNTEGVDLEFCQGCLCIWFAKGQLAFYVEQKTDIPDFAPDTIANGRPTQFSCPSCTNVLLLEINYIPNEGLLVDFCRQCKGILLDRGELQTVERLGAKYHLVDISGILKHIGKYT